MKRGIWSGFVLALLIAPAAEAAEYLKIAASGTTTTYYFVASAIAKVAEKYIPGVKGVPEVTGGSVENVRLVAAKKVPLGLTTPDVAFYAHRGGRAFKEPLEGLRAVLGGQVNAEQIFVLDRSPIRKISDLRGKRVSVGQPGSAAEVIAGILLEAHGLKRGQDYKPEFLTFSEATSALKDGTIDAVMLASGLPTPAVMDIATTHTIRFIPLDEETLRQVTTQHPYYRPIKIKAGTYRGMTEDVTALAVGTVLVGHKDLDVGLIYQVTKVILEHTEELGTIHPAGKEWNAENAVQGIAIPFHPGAERYLRERSLWR